LFLRPQLAQRQRFSEADVAIMTSWICQLPRNGYASSINFAKEPQNGPTTAASVAIGPFPWGLATEAMMLTVDDYGTIRALIATA
jgi:hypothetical protein